MYGLIEMVVLLLLLLLLFLVVVVGLWTPYKMAAGTGLDEPVP